MKKYIFTASVLCLTLFASGCGAKVTEEPIASDNIENIIYTNITTENDKKILTTLMDNAGISKERQNILFEHTEQFNSAVKPEELTNGFEEIKIGETKYDPYDIQDEWVESYPDFFGYNCRITAFSLFEDFMDIPTGSETNDYITLFDKSSLETDSSAMVNTDSIDKFSVLYSTVPTEETKDIDVHIDNMQRAWEEKGITFNDNNSASLVSVVFHGQDDGDFLFIGHTGILFEAEDGIYFLEKIAFQEPYQLVKLKDRQALSDYMMIKYDVEENQPTASPFILENDELIEGYRTASEIA